MNNYDWNKPLLRIFDGYDDLLRETSNFPHLGTLPPLGEIKEIEKIEEFSTSTLEVSSSANAIIVVVVSVAVAARPGAMTNDEVLKAKLLDVYSPKERATLHDAISLVQKHPSLIKSSLGIEPKSLGDDFNNHLDRIKNVLS